MVIPLLPTNVSYSRHKGTGGKRLFVPYWRFARISQARDAGGTGTPAGAGSFYISDVDFTASAPITPHPQSTVRAFTGKLTALLRLQRGAC